jgi:hypothetical protein
MSYYRVNTSKIKARRGLGVRKSPASQKKRAGTTGAPFHNINLFLVARHRRHLGLAFENRVLGQHAEYLFEALCFLFVGEALLNGFPHGQPSRP